MNELHVCFIGVGSIAKRHIKNLTALCEVKKIKLTIDAVRRNHLDNEYPGIRNIYSKIEDAESIYDVVFITNPTEFHLETLKRATPYGRHFFIEKPLSSVSQLDMIQGVELKQGSVYYVACPLRYNAVIQFIKNNINFNDVISARCISSSYLPDWRPNVDYRSTYSAQKKLGGGVSIDLIHEWDYITALFGFPQTVHSLMGKKSKLEIDSEDFAIYIAEYPHITIELHLDYYGRKSIREIMLFTDEDTIVGDIANNRIAFLRSGRTIQFEEERDDYQKRELLHFMDMIDGQIYQDNNIQHAAKVLKLTQGVV